ncbi:MAG: hypothetical protein LBV55_02440 [Acholeplasmatales bacterium]|jgi:hypothetical protein|nr:hypothetical protein [Acholeplasmatales bacterium]
MYRVYNAKLFKKVHGEPIDVQKLNDGSIVKIYSFNIQDSYQSHIARKVYYVWACKGKDYIMFVDDEYYSTFQELFTVAANQTFIQHLNRLLKYNFINKIISYATLGIVLVFLIVSLIVSSVTNNSKLSNAALYAVVGSLVVVLVTSFIFKNPQSKSLKTYQSDMNNLFGESGIEAIVKKQVDFYASKEPQIIETNDEPTENEELVPSSEIEHLDGATSEEVIGKEPLAQPTAEEEDASKEPGSNNKN